MDDIVAQFMAVTSCEGPTAQQYLEASDWNLEQAVGLFFASGGVTAESQSAPAPSSTQDDEVRDRIAGFDDQLIDEEAQMFNEAMRNSRKAEARARKPRGIFNQERDADINTQQLSKHERRLANLFRPPFDIITDLSLEEAKEEAQHAKKLLMINVQDSGEFDCQRLNRDLWRSFQVKEIVSTNFVFLQFDIEDPDGEDYRVLYPFESFPHIAILDPWTGEQQKTWSKVPEVAEFIEEIVDFVANCSNDILDEPIHDDSHENGEASPTVLHQTSDAPLEEMKSSEPPSSLDEIVSIPASDAPEPPQGPNTTRIQLRYGDGKRTVRRFLLDDNVKVIYSVAKHVLNVTGGVTLTSERRDLQTELDKTIEEANLKNSTVLVEID